MRFEFGLKILVLVFCVIFLKSYFIFYFYFVVNDIYKQMECLRRNFGYIIQIFYGDKGIRQLSELMKIFVLNNLLYNVKVVKFDNVFGLFIIYISYLN